MADLHMTAGGGNPAEYWALPFSERCRHHSAAGAKVRDISYIGLGRVKEPAVKADKKEDRA